MADRSFTLEEAQMLLPTLESLLRVSIEGKKLIESVDTELQELAHRVFLQGGLQVNVVHMARRKAEREKSIQRVKDGRHVHRAFFQRRPVRLPLHAPVDSLP